MVSCGDTPFGYLLAKRGDSPVLPREVAGTNGEFLTISASIRSRSISQPFTTEGLSNPDHPRSIVQPKASLLDFFQNQFAIWTILISNSKEKRHTETSNSKCVQSPNLH